MRRWLSLFPITLAYLCLFAAWAQKPAPAVVPVNGDCIREWLVIGPFFPRDPDTDFLAGVGGEANVDPREGDTFTTEDGRTLTWRRYNSRGDLVQIDDAIGRHVEATAYAFCVLQSEITSRIPFGMGHDNDVKVWINGRHVYQDTGVREPVLPYSDTFTFDAVLETGRNRCLVKIAQEIGFWGFAMRVLPTEQGMGLSGIEGRVLALDRKTGHVAVPVEAVLLTGSIAEPIVVGTALTDGNGNYRLAVLKPGKYLVRCQVPGGYVYYTGRRDASGVMPYTSQALKSTDASEDGEILRFEERGDLRGIDFYIAPFKKGIWKEYSKLDGLADDDFNAVCGSADGMIWFGTAFGGVSRFDGKDFVNFTTDDGLVDNAINTIYCDSNGIMWFGTRNGVSLYDGREFASFTSEDGLINDDVCSIYQDSDGVLWFGTNRGISCYDGKKITNLL